MPNNDNTPAEEFIAEGTKEATEIVGECYTELSKYVTRTRAYASVVDGMKTVYRRVLYASAHYHNRVKSASIVGDALKLHPHGDASVYDTLVQMACEFGRFPLYNKKGNFGGQGQGYAAMRYTEAVLSDLARLMYLELIDYAEMIDGEAGNPEPKYLPALIPYCLLVGTTAIPVGMPVPNIPPYNALELVNFYIDVLEGKTPTYPTLDLGEIIIDCGREDCMNEMTKNGQGKIWYKGLITQEDTYKFVVTSETPGCNFWKLRSKVDGWIEQDILDYSDETDANGDRHVFTITNPAKLSPDELRGRLDWALKCSETYRFILEEDEKAVYCGFDYIVAKSLKYLRECSIRKFQDYSSKTNSRLLVLQAIRDFKNAGYVNGMDSRSDEDAIEKVVSLGYEEWVGKVMLDKPMRYLTKSHDQEILDLEEELRSYQNYVENPDQYLLGLYYQLREKIIPIYNKRGHSIVGSELASMKQKYASLQINEQKILVSEDPDSGVTWNRMLFLVSDDGTVTSKYVNSRSNVEIDINDNDHIYSMVGSDKGKYLVIILDRNIVVKRLDDLTGSRQRFKTWDGLRVTGLFTSSSDTVRMTDERGNTCEIHLPDWEKSRISNPSRAMKYDIKEVIEI